MIAGKRREGFSSRQRISRPRLALGTAQIRGTMHFPTHLIWRSVSLSAIWQYAALTLTISNSAKLNAVYFNGSKWKNRVPHTRVVESRCLVPSFKAQWSLYVPDTSTLERSRIQQNIYEFHILIQTNSYFAWRLASAADKWHFRFWDVTQRRLVVI